MSLLERIVPQTAKLIINHPPYWQRQDPSTWRISPRTQTDYDLFICFSGSVRFHIGADVYDIRPQSAVLVPPRIRVSATSTTDDEFIGVAQHFDLLIFNTIDYFSLMEYDPLIHFSDWKFIKRLCDEYWSAWQTPTHRLYRHSLFRVIISRYIQHAYRADAVITDNTFGFLLDVLTCIDEHFRDHDVLERAFRNAPFVYDYGASLFRKTVGTSPQKYIMRKRLSHAKCLLEYGHRVKDTAHESGFRDEYYFSRLFKKYEGITPREYRMSYSLV